MKPPIFAIDGHDVLVFKTVASAQQYLEPEDIENEVYVFFDSQGRKLRATYSISPRRVSLYSEEKTPSYAVELRAVLRQFLKRVGVDHMWVKQATQEELIEKVVLDYSIN